MIWIIIFYWIICGFALNQKNPGGNIISFIFGMVFGGVIIPTLIIRKAIK